MKRIFTLYFLLLQFAPIISAQNPRYDVSADSAYLAGEYAVAVEKYRQEINESGTSWQLYYNLGNCYYRLGKLADAVICYERALRLNPSNSNIRNNLSFVNTKLIDKKGYNGTVFSRTITDITNLISSNGWAWTALLLFLLTIGAAALYIFCNNVLIRKIGFFGGGFTILGFLSSIILSINAFSLMKADNLAIVKAQSSILSTIPRTPKDRSEEAMLLHEGARLEILDSISSPTDSMKTVWYDVKFDNDHRAWINSNDIEKI